MHFAHDYYHRRQQDTVGVVVAAPGAAAAANADASVSAQIMEYLEAL